MRVTCKWADLHRGIQTAGKAAAARAPLPILQHVLLQAQGERLTLTCTDQEVGMQISIPAVVETAGEATALARLLTDVVGDLDRSEVCLSVDEHHNLVLTSPMREFTFDGLVPDEFPRHPDVSPDVEIKLPVGMFREIIEQTIFCVARDDSRPPMTGVYFTVDDSALTAVATDTHRLSMRQTTIPQGQGQAQVILPEKALSLFTRSTASDSESTVCIRIARNRVLMQCDDITLVSRVVEGPYPNYERVVPSGFESSMIAPRDALQKAVRRVSFFAQEEKSNRLVFRANGDVLLLSAETSGVGRAREEVPIAHQGPAVDLAFNAVYLNHILGVLPGESVVFEVTGPLTPCVMRSPDLPDYRYIVMPMQTV